MPKAIRRGIGRELSLPDQLRQAIEDSGLSSSEIARQAEISHAQVLRFLSGERDLRLETAGLICQALGLALAEASRGRGRPKKTKTHHAESLDFGGKHEDIESGEPLETHQKGDLDT